MVGEAGERREGRGGEEGGVQADDGAQDDPRELWDPGLHGDQAVASVIGGEGGPGFAFDNSTLPPTELENPSLAADDEEELAGPIMLTPSEVPFMPKDALPSMPLIPIIEFPAASMPCLMLCWELPSRGLLSLKKGNSKHVVQNVGKYKIFFWKKESQNMFDRMSGDI